MKSIIQVSLIAVLMLIAGIISINRFIPFDWIQVLVLLGQLILITIGSYLIYFIWHKVQQWNRKLLKLIRVYQPTTLIRRQSAKMVKQETRA